MKTPPSPQQSHQQPQPHPNPPQPILEPERLRKNTTTSTNTDAGLGKGSVPPESASSSQSSTPSDPESRSPSQDQNPANGNLRPPTQDERDSLSPEELLAHRLAFGLQLLAQKPEYRNLLMYPADAYSTEVAELISREAELRQKLAPARLKQGEALFSESQTTKVKSADFERQQAAADKHLREQLEAAEAKAAEIGGLNLWAVPVANPNANYQGLPAFGLVWATLPEGKVPIQLSSWLTEDWVTKRKGPVLTLRQDAFPVSPELWSVVGVGALLKARAYKLEPVPPES